MGLITKPCMCCNQATCCSVLNPNSVDFVCQSPYFEDRRAIMTGAYSKCIGRSEFEVVVYTPTSTAMVCTAACKSAGQCVDYAGHPEIKFEQAVFAELVGAMDRGGFKVNYYPPSVIVQGASGTPPYPYTNLCAFDLLYDSGSSVTRNCYCTGADRGSTNEYMFEMQLDEESYTGNAAIYVKNKYLPSVINDFNNYYSQNPLTFPAVYNGKTCEYIMYGLDVARNMQTNMSVCCSNTKICWTSIQWIQIRCAVRCAQTPCPSSNYPFPLTLTATNDNPYKKQTIAGSTDCTFYLDSTEKYYADNKCQHKAVYQGILRANEVDCSSHPNDLDCKCCGEA